MTKINVKGIEIEIMKVRNKDYISLTDMIRAKDGEFFIKDWLRNRKYTRVLGHLGKIT